MSKVSVLDLTIAQITGIETAIGSPFTAWDEVAHPADLYARIYAVHEGRDVEPMLAMTLRELTELVTLESGEDPSSPSEPEK